MIKSGALGELATMKHFLGLGFEVYAAVTDSSTYDAVLAKNGRLYKVEVKTTAARNRQNTGWVVQIKSVRSNKTQNRIVEFDNTKVDYLAVYISPIDKVVVYEATSMKQKNSVSILDADIGAFLHAAAA